MHLLVRWCADKALSDLLRNLKRNSSLWIHENFRELRDFHWQDGYGAFTVSPSLQDKVKAYIACQQDHHRERDFRSELIALLEAYGVDYKAEYL